MADKKISALTASSTPLAGTEVLPIVQGGSTVKVSVADLTAGRAVGTAALTASGLATLSVGVVVGDGSFAQSKIYSSAANGLLIIGKTGTTNDLLIAAPGGNPAITIPTGTEDVKVSNGNLIIGTAGKGIDFSANTHAAGMTSELLNDYEEGNWTPTYSGWTVAPTTAYARYTRVGRLVTINYTAENGTATAASGVIGGLPFTSNAQQGASVAMKDNSFNSPGVTAFATIGPSSTNIQSMTAAGFAGLFWSFSVTYMV